MKIAFIYSEDKLAGKLTKFWTGSYCYHVALVDEENKKMYDQHLLLRRRRWPYYGSKTLIKLVDTPVSISREYMEDLLDSDNNIYGWLDYIMFAFRPIYHLFGKSTRNAKGVICSELIHNILVARGWEEVFVEVPSPADLERVLLK